MPAHPPVSSASSWLQTHSVTSALSAGRSRAIDHSITSFRVQQSKALHERQTPLVAHALTCSSGARGVLGSGLCSHLHSSTSSPALVGELVLDHLQLARQGQQCRREQDQHQRDREPPSRGDLSHRCPSSPPILCPSVSLSISVKPRWRFAHGTEQRGEASCRRSVRARSAQSRVKHPAAARRLRCRLAGRMLYPYLGPHTTSKGISTVTLSALTALLSMS